MTLGSLFDGISGFPLAASWCGIETKWISEIDEYCLKVSKKNFPNAIQYGDIKEIGKGRKWEPEYVDIISGGFPCQSFSLEGLGEMDFTLWKEMFRVICEVQPRWVFAENVLGLVARENGMALELVCSDLENEGYTVFPPLILPACSKQAPHRRERVWILAYSNIFGRDFRGEKTGDTEEGTKEIKSSGCSSGEIWESSEICTAEFCGMANGIPNWMDRNQGGGNAIVPQVAYEIFKSIKQLNKF